MKVNKCFMILAIFLMLFSCMSVISAAENVTVDENVVVDENVTVIGDFKSLQKETVNRTSVALDKDYAFDLNDENETEIVIEQDDFEIDGQGHSIDAKGQSRIFVINAKNVVLKNINFLNGKATNGGAVLVNENADNLKIYDCRFENNSADIGGAIDCHAKGCEVKDTVFNKNQAIGAGATCFKYATTLINDVYTYNNATYCGALIHCGGIRFGERIVMGNSYDESKGIIENCVFDNNTAETYGVGISYVSGHIKNTNFTNNHAKTCSALALASSLSDGAFQMTGCNFINNTAKEIGALWSRSNSKTITINKCNFQNNTAELGAAVCSMVRGVNRFISCNFYDNHAKYGGAIYATAFGSINRCSFDNNTAQTGGAIMINQSYPIIFNIGYSSFTNNTGNDGEAIYTTSDVNAYGNTFDGKDLTLTGNAKYHEFDDKMEWGRYVAKEVAKNY